MKNIVFIVGEYYPYYSGVGRCVSTIAELLAKDNNVSIVCAKNQISLKYEEEYKGQKIYRVKTKDIIIREKLSKGITQGNILKRVFSKIVLVLYKIFVALRTIFSKVSLKRSLIKAFDHKLQELFPAGIDVIIPASYPMESVISAMEYKRHHSSVKMIPLLFDPFTDSLTLHRLEINRKIKRNRHLKIEREMLEISNKTILMNHLRPFFESNFGEYLPKLFFIEHPLLRNKCKGNNKSNSLNLVYTGVFDKIIRNPQRFLEFMEKALRALNARLNIYSYGNCDYMIKETAQRNKDTIIFHGKVTGEQADKALEEGNILICLGNVDNIQVPSKIIELMSYGKPIIHFFTNTEDHCLIILKNYPLSLKINLNESFESQIESFIEFCTKNKESSLAFDDIKEKYYEALPDYAADIIRAV